ncbi:hypothetical protein FI667_g1695, partial [Globisporangium splendens]
MATPTPPDAAIGATRASLRHRRLIDGAQLIKSYVHESELRRGLSRFDNAPFTAREADARSTTRLKGHREGDDETQLTAGAEMDRMEKKQDDVRIPMEPHAASSYRLRHGNQQYPRRTIASNQYEEAYDEVAHATEQPLAAFFASKQVRRARRLSISAAHAAQALANANANQTGTSNNANSNNMNPVKPVLVVKRKLQMESMAAPHPYRTTATSIVSSSRGKINLSSELDAVIKTSPWMRRKVVLNDDKTLRGGSPIKLQHSPRHGSVAALGSDNGTDSLASVNGVASGVGNISMHSSSNGRSTNVKDLSQYEIEKKVMAAFSQSTGNVVAAVVAVVRMWRDRKRRGEAKTLTMMNGNKLRKDNGIESSHVVGILSRRMIREVPALTFFDVEPETNAASSSTGATKTTSTTSSTTTHSAGVQSV